jgi:uncharacterized protein YdhG (YjbR/CyaY superfamily)
MEKDSLNISEMQQILLICRRLILGTNVVTPGFNAPWAAGSGAPSFPDDGIAGFPLEVFSGYPLPWRRVAGSVTACYEGNRMKTDPTAPQDIDEYIAGFPSDVQEKLEKIRMTIREAAPDAEEAIKYQIPTFVLKGNLVHFAAFKNHIGFYPAPRGIEEFKEELSAYEGAKGSVRFPLDQPIPFDLISRIVQFRVKDNLGKVALKKKKRQEGRSADAKR